jgi:hypothetical protein
MEARSVDEPVELTEDAVDAVSDTLIEHTLTAVHFRLPEDEIIVTESERASAASGSDASADATSERADEPVAELKSAAEPVDTDSQLDVMTITAAAQSKDVDGEPADQTEEAEDRDVPAPELDDSPAGTESLSKDLAAETADAGTA